MTVIEEVQQVQIVNRTEDNVTVFLVMEVVDVMSVLQGYR